MKEPLPLRRFSRSPHRGRGAPGRPTAPRRIRPVALARSVGVAATIALFAVACVTELPEDESVGLATTVLTPVTTSSPPQTIAADDESEEAEVVETTTTTTEPPPEIGLVELVAYEATDEIREPIAMAFRPGEDDMIYVAQRQGTVRRLKIGSSRSRGIRHDARSGYALDLRDETDLRTSSTSSRDDTDDDSDDDGATAEDVSARGMRGMAISTDGRRIYLSYTDSEGTTHIDEWSFRDEQIQESSRRGVLKVADSFADVRGNNLGFGPDGFLYIGLGVPDTAAGLGAAQDPGLLAGSLIRIDPEEVDEQRYVVPDGNPFADGALGLPEVFLYGVRQPHRFTWDRSTGDLWLVDAGRDQRDEINFLPAALGAGRGANLGWDIFEGTRAIDPDVSDLPGHVPPLQELEQGEYCGANGGYVYRGTAIPALEGIYVFGDDCDARLHGLVVDSAGEVVDIAPLRFDQTEQGDDPTGVVFSGFAENGKGEFYGFSTTGDAIYRFVAPEVEEEEEDEDDEDEDANG